MDENELLQRIKEEKIIAIVRGVQKSRILDAVKALEAGGIRCMEIAVDQTSAETVRESVETIHFLKGKIGNRVFLGAGTVLTPEQVNEVTKAGAEYIISPNVSEDVIRHSREVGVLSIPGALTPSEAVNAYRFGANIVKIFPGGLLGADYIKALRGPLRYIPFMAVGGIYAENIAAFLKAGACGVGVGGNLVSLKAIQAGDFAQITRTAEEYVGAIRNLQ